MEPEQALKDFGLNDKEIKVYLALLNLGTTSVHKIAEKADIIRTTTYDILKSLIEKGLASYVIKSGVKYFEAANPEKIIAILEEKKTAIQEILPALNKIKEIVLEKPTVEIYEGKEGVKTIMEDFLKTKKTIYGYSSCSFYNTLSYYFPHFRKRRAKLGIKSRVIMEKSPQTIDFKKSNKEEMREMRFLPQLAKHKIGYYIYGDKLAILLGAIEEPIGILIHNKEIADFEREKFEMIWNQTKR
jgi:sugar-specific transcriptional regulator TrmB